MKSEDCSALAVQGSKAGGIGRESDFRGRCRERGSDGDRSEGRAGEVTYCYYYKKLGHTKYNCPLLRGKQHPF